MNNKLWILIAGVAGVAILALGWFLGVSPKLGEMSAANDQKASVDAQNQQHEVKLDALKKEFAKLDALKTQLADAQASLPPGDDLSTFLGELHQLEASSGVVLSSFSAGDGIAYVAAPGEKSQSKLITAANFIAIPIDLTVTGTRPQVIAFLSDLQYGKRLFLVNKLAVTQSTKAVASAPGVTAAPPVDAYEGNISGFVYVLVDPSAPPPTPTPVGALNTTPSPSPSPSP